MALNSYPPATTSWMLKWKVSCHAPRLKMYFSFIYECFACMHIFALHACCTHRGQNRALDWILWNWRFQHQNCKTSIVTSCVFMDQAQHVRQASSYFQNYLFNIFRCFAMDNWNNGRKSLPRKRNELHSSVFIVLGAGPDLSQRVFNTILWLVIKDGFSFEFFTG